MAQFNIMTEEERKTKLLQDLYKLTDEYNRFVINMDKKLDKVLSSAEGLHDSEIVC